MSRVDRYLVMALFGTFLAAFIATGEFLGWWPDEGTPTASGVLRVAAGVVFAVLAALAVAAALRAHERLRSLEAHTAETVVLLREIRDRL